MSGPLTGIRVIDLTSVVMGPYATQILGDMGADVIKIEPPEGDMFRYALPARHRGMSAPFLNLNRNKRSLVLDLKAEHDRETLRKLIDGADVFVTTVRPQGMRRLGLDYESVSEANPRLIYCGAYGFSEEGPYSGRPAFDDIIQAMCGVAALQGAEDHGGTGAPKYVKTIFADKTVGFVVVYSIAMALYERERSGKGQAIEVPMFETMVSYTLIEHLAGETFLPPEGRMRYGRILSPHRGPYRTRDGFISLLPYTTAQWVRFFNAVGRPDLSDDARLTNAPEHIDELYQIVTDIVSQLTTAELCELLEKADIPMTRVLSPEDLLEDPHLKQTGFFKWSAHPSEGEIRQLGIPVRFSRTPGSLRLPAPSLDQHRGEIVSELESKE